MSASNTTNVRLNHASTMMSSSSSSSLLLRDESHCTTATRAAPPAQPAQAASHTHRRRHYRRTVASVAVASAMSISTLSFLYLGITSVSLLSTSPAGAGTAGAAAASTTASAASLSTSSSAATSTCETPKTTFQTRKKKGTTTTKRMKTHHDRKDDLLFELFDSLRDDMDDIDGRPAGEEEGGGHQEDQCTDEEAEGMLADLLSMGHGGGNGGGGNNNNGKGNRSNTNNSNNKNNNNNINNNNINKNGNNNSNNINNNNGATTKLSKSNSLNNDAVKDDNHSFDYGVKRLYNPNINFNTKKNHHRHNHHSSNSNDQSQNSENDNDNNNDSDNNDNNDDSRDSILILATIDGTLAGISRSSGQILWKQSQDNYSLLSSENGNLENAVHPSSSSSSSLGISSSVAWNKFLSPLVSTTTCTAASEQHQQHQQHQHHDGNGNGNPHRHPNCNPHHPHHNNHPHFHAVPSIDGTVYITVEEEGSGNDQYSSEREDNDNNDDTPIHELSVNTHIRDLVDSAPFVDAHGRFFVGSRRAMVAAVDERTGEILRVIPKWKGGGRRRKKLRQRQRQQQKQQQQQQQRRREDEAGETIDESFMDDNSDGSEGIFQNDEWAQDEDDGYGDDGDDDNDDDDDDDDLAPSLAGRDVVWIGRLEHTVTVHDLSNGKVDIEFSVAEILSVDEMIRGNRRQDAPSMMLRRNEDEQGGISDGEGGGNDDEAEYIDDIDEESDGMMEHVLTSYITEALRHPNFGDRLLELPSPEELENKDKTPKDGRKGSSMSKGSPFLVSTPRGHVAFRDSISASSGWISFDMLDSPVVYAIEGSSGQKIRVNILPDAPSSTASDPVAASSDSNKNNLHQLLERQIASMTQQASLLSTGPMNGQGSVVGALHNGQLYALPLGVHSSSKPHLPLGLPQPNSLASNMVQVQDPAKRKITELKPHHAIGFHEHGHYFGGEDVDPGDKQHIRIDQKTKHLCIPSSPLYPGCLVGASLPIGHMMEHLLDGNFGAFPEEVASAFASSDIDFDLYLDLLEGNSRKKNSFFHQFLKIMSSWIAPTVALIFVVSFELGRRERLKAANSLGNGAAIDESKESNNIKPINQGAIQLTDEILGYGGHGTIVYKGVLDKRKVAVKRLLNMYHASADREISLLIESDGHQNVVRYFLKEMRGDFVYLALELCDMSLNDLIVSLSKLKNARKENFQLSGNDDFESATKSLLFQIASGVRHIHSLRIVHRDLKPQNILLAQRCKSKPAIEQEENVHSDSDTEIDDTTTYSDTNSILESFKNGDYVPKISDMGLGKQLVGQSSFGISTLGNGSVGVGPAGNASMTGAGAGSVGWQAPEVMAMRWSPESSSSHDGSESMVEASPLEVAINSRTSRSVDIFSLGCIFYCTILPGSHPFGEWYEREANIMKNNPNKEDLEFVSPDASDLILSMINRDAKARPTADEVCDHPFFWSLSKRLKFLCELSDKIELCDTMQGNDESSLLALNIFSIEKGAVELFGTSWEKKLDPELMEASLNRRTYDPSSVRDCLRMIRNKHHHYDELSTSLKSRIGSNTDGLSRYINQKFPRLLMHCYHFCLDNIAADDSLAIDYTLPIPKLSSLKSNANDGIPKTLVSRESRLEENKKCPPLEPIPDNEAQEKDEDEPPALISSPILACEAKNAPLCVSGIEETLEVNNSPDVILKRDNSSDTADCPEEQILDHALDDDMSGIVVWCGSNAAKKLNCRGWIRSEDEWIQRLDAKLRKRDANLARCADDPKFRTRLCNHWDVSGGTHCPMRKKNKCIFAHGPVELRVKEGKHHRWGTLVNKHGLCANPCASGGEDTYGTARSIEKTRKEQGQWSVETAQKKQQGKGKPKGKHTPNKKK